MIKFKKTIVVASLLIILFIPSLVVKAQDVTGTPTEASHAVTGGPTTFGLKSPLNNINSVGALVNKFVEVFTYLVIIFAVLAIVWTGLQLILARGAPDKMKEASVRLGYILIGVAIVIGAKIMISIIINTLEATGTVSPTVIQNAKDGLQNK